MPDTTFHSKYYNMFQFFFIFPCTQTSPKNPGNTSPATTKLAQDMKGRIPSAKSCSGSVMNPDKNNFTKLSALI